MFSVLIPVYNHEKYVTDAVVSALQSSLVNEILIVDDGSNDSSASKIRTLLQFAPKRIRDLTEPNSGNRGTHIRLNELVKEARNEWIAILNSDDVFMPGRFEILAAAIGRSGVNFVWGHLLIIDAAGSPIGLKRGLLNPEYPLPSHLSRANWRSECLADMLASQNLIATTSNMVFTRELHQRIGGFSNFRYCHDWAFALRAAARGRPLHLPHFLTGYRIHGHNTISASQSTSAPEVKEMMDQFVLEFPEFTDRARFREWLSTNVYLQVRREKRTTHAEG